MREREEVEEVGDVEAGVEESSVLLIIFWAMSTLYCAISFQKAVFSIEYLMPSIMFIGDGVISDSCLLPFKDRTLLLESSHCSRRIAAVLTSLH